MAFGETIQLLTTQPGLGALSRRLSRVPSFYNEPNQLGDVSKVVQNFLKSDPRLADVRLQLRPGIQGGYFPKRDLVSLGVVNPAVVGHELGHAENLRKAPVYSKILNLTQNMANINNKVAIPAMLAIRTLVGNRDTRNEILSILSGASAAIAAPALVEEMSASLQAVRKTPNKLQAIKSLMPAFLTHAVHSLMPAGIYQVGKFT